MAVGPDGSPYFRGRVPDVALAAAGTAAVSSAASASQSAAVTAGRGPSRVTFEVTPGKMQLRLSVEGTASQVLDTEMREINVPDLTAPQTSLGTPELFRARTVREYQQLKIDPDAIPLAGREFGRTDRLFVRIAAYGPGGTTPAISVHILNRSGQAMNELPVTPSTKAGLQQVDIPLAGLAPGEYVLEIKATGEGGEAKELVGFRVTG
jgi:hypothetical protein